MYGKKWKGSTRHPMPTLSSVPQTLLFCLVILCPLIHYHGNSAHPTNLLTTQSTPLSHLLSSEPTTQSHLPTHLQTLPPPLPSSSLSSHSTHLSVTPPPPSSPWMWGEGGGGTQVPKGYPLPIGHMQWEW